MIRHRLEQLRVKALSIEPKPPCENGYAESFHSKLLEAFFNAEEFASSREAHELTPQFQGAYNHACPHGGFGGETPAVFAASCTPQGELGPLGIPDAPLAVTDASEEFV